MILFRSFQAAEQKTRQTSFVAQDDADDDDDEIDDDDNKNINDVYDDDNNNDDNDANNAQRGSPQQRQMWGSLKGETILPAGGLFYKLWLANTDVWFTTQLVVANLCKVTGQNICLKPLRVCDDL